MNILVTGGAGFIGSHFIERVLAQTTATIVCLDNFNDYYDPKIKRAHAAALAGNNRVEIVEADFCDLAADRRLFAAHRFTHVMHLGAYAGVRESVRRPLVYQQANVGGTLAILEAAREFPPQRMVSASSSTVYGKGAAIPFQEDAPLGVPQSPYGATKRAAELLCQTYHELHGLDVVCVRPFSVYGPRLRPDLALSIFARAILREEPLTLFGDGSIRRDFTHVNDICDGLWAALTKENLGGQVFNLGHSEPIEMRRVIELLAAALGKRARIEQKEQRPEDLPVTFADLSKAGRLLGYRPQTPFTEGIREFAQWYQTHHAG